MSHNHRLAEAVLFLEKSGLADEILKSVGKGECEIKEKLLERAIYSAATRGQRSRGKRDELDKHYFRFIKDYLELVLSVYPAATKNGSASVDNKGYSMKLTGACVTSFSTAWNSPEVVRYRSN